MDKTGKDQTGVTQQILEAVLRLEERAKASTDTEHIDALEQALDEIDKLIDIMYLAPRDLSGDEEFDEAYKKYNEIAERVYVTRHNRYVEENKPDGKQTLSYRCNKVLK